MPSRNSRTHGARRGSHVPRPSLALVAAIGWGLSQTQRANVSAEDAASYRTVLATLGGKEFRVGTLNKMIAHPLEGSVVLYDSHQGQSWGIVLVRAPGVSGEAAVTLSTGDGADDMTIDAGPSTSSPTVTPRRGSSRPATSRRTTISRSRRTMGPSWRRPRSPRPSGGRSIDGCSAVRAPNRYLYE